MDTELHQYLPPVEVVNNAKKGLELRGKFKRGSTKIGIARAHQLSNRELIDPPTILRMASYFARHEVDKKAKNFGNDNNPSKGYIAWLLWGGDEGKKWVDQLKEQMNS